MAELTDLLLETHFSQATKTELNPCIVCLSNFRLGEEILLACKDNDIRYSFNGKNHILILFSGDYFEPKVYFGLMQDQQKLIPLYQNLTFSITLYRCQIYCQAYPFCHTA